MNLDELRALAASVGFPDPALAAAVAMAESGGDPRIANIVTDPLPGNGPERSFGLWQINTLAHPNYDEGSLLDPTYNAKAAYQISSAGTNWFPWSTYTTGRYKEFYTRSLTFTPAVVTAISLGLLGAAGAVAYLIEPSIFDAPRRLLGAGHAAREARDNPQLAEANENALRPQTFLFAKDEWTAEQAKRWLKEHRRRSRLTAESERYYRFRQESPDNFDPNSFRTKDFGDGIRVVVGR